jgi:hypothetical protein
MEDPRICLEGLKTDKKTPGRINTVTDEIVIGHVKISISGPTCSVEGSRRNVYNVVESKVYKRMRHVDPLLCNDTVNTFSRHRIRTQQSDNFRCYAKRSEYKNRGIGVFYVVHIYPLLGNGCVF